MTDSAKRVAELVQECYDRARDLGSDTRTTATGLVESLPPDLLRFMASEFIVAAVARAQRAAALNVERSAQSRGGSAETVSIKPPARDKRWPAKGTADRLWWEENTDEGKAAVADEMRSLQMFYGVIGTALDRYTEDLHIKWTDELLASSFALADGTSVTWGAATVEQHAERRQMFLNNAHGNMEGAARHELAMRELREAGASTLSEMVSVAA